MKFLSKLVILIFLITIFSVNTLSSEIIKGSEQQCIEGGGTWTIPQLALGDDPLSSKKNLIPYCNCKIGSFWNSTANYCQDDSQIRCFQTDGNWLNNSCECPNGTIKWTEGFGCDTSGPDPKSDPLAKANNVNSSKLIIYIGLIIVVALLSLCLFYIKKRNKNEISK